LTRCSLPDGLTNLDTLFLEGNRLRLLVLPDSLAATNLAATVTSLRNQGVSVFAYPLAASLISPRRTENGDFEFTVTGPPSVYTVFGSIDLAAWSELGVTTNALGRSVFIDATGAPSERKFYRARFAL